MNKVKYAFIVLFCGCGMVVSAQKYEMSVPDFSLAVDLFENQKYSAAQQHFNAIVKSDANVTREQKVDAEFYASVCALRLFNPDGLFLMKQFIENYPESPRMYKAYFEAANYLFHEQQYEQALDFYQKTDVQRFTNSEVLEYLYKKGYSYYKMNEIAVNAGEPKANTIYAEKSTYFELAKPLFKEVKNATNTPYAENALFYYSYLEYVDGNYEVAMTGFESLADSSMFAPVVAPYICQIYYQNGE